MKINKLLLIIVLLFLLVQGVYAIGVAPSSNKLILSEMPSSYSLRIFNEGGEKINVDLEVTGELSEYITLSKSSIEFKQGEEKEDITITINLPEENKILPGEYIARIIIKERSSGTGEIIAFLGISSRIVMIVPGEGANIQANVFTPNFIKGKQNTFSVEVTNKGNKAAEDCKAILVIYSSLNAEIDTLLAHAVSINPGTTQRIQLSWTPNVLSGNYIAKAKVMCRIGESSAEHIFSIGSPEVKVVSFVPEEFTLDGISQFSLVVTSEWAETIENVYANVELYKEDALIRTSKTESKNINSQDVGLYNVFLNTKDIAPGSYKIFVKMNYLGKETETVYGALFSFDKAVLTSLTGKVTGGGSESQSGFDDGNGLNSLLVMAIVIVVILNVVLVIYIVKRRKK